MKKERQIGGFRDMFPVSVIDSVKRDYKYFTPSLFTVKGINNLISLNEEEIYMKGR